MVWHISASWNTLKSQITVGLNFCASDCHTELDIGAFFVRKGTQWFWDGDYDQGYDVLAKNYLPDGISLVAFYRYPVMERILGGTVEFR